MPRSTLIRPGLFVLMVAIVATMVACADASNPQGSSGRTVVPVLQVVDGDTIRVELDRDVTLVRLIGIDTPERDGPHTSLECYGEEASNFTTDALGGHTIELEFDVERLDRFGRTLAYVWLNGELFNERIVREGFANVSTFPPNVRYVDHFTDAQRLARDQQLGLWGGCLQD